MKNTLIYIPEAAHRRLRYQALDQRTSMTALIRKAIDYYIKKDSKKGRRR